MRDEKPPSAQTYLGISSRAILALSFIFRRCQGFWRIWDDAYDIPIFRSIIHGRCVVTAAMVRGKKVK